MSTPSKRQLILEAVRDRLKVIHGSQFETEAGRKIYLGFVPELGPDDPDEAIAVLPEPDEPTFQGEHVLVRWPIGIHAIAKANLSEPWVVVEQVIADIKRAMELEDRRLGGLVKPFMERGSVQAVGREPGSTTVGAVVPYRVSFTEVWGAPES